MALLFKPAGETGAGRLHMDYLVSAVGFPLGRFVSSESLAGHHAVTSPGQSLEEDNMKTLTVLNAHAAAIDVGSEQLHVSIAGGRPEVFGTMTGDLHRVRDYLMGAGAKTVAMEATGVYWLCLYEVLEGAGLEVMMVNGKHVKNLPGRKTDMADCQWLATLHAHGLLRAGFVPPAHIRRLQDYVRLRADHITMGASHVQHMQKALDRMNLKVHEVLSSLTGMSGLAMIRAILDGERDPEKLLQLCDQQIQRKKAERMREALRGSYRAEHLFALKQALQGWEFYQAQAAACDREIERCLNEMAPPGGNDSEPSGSARKDVSANAPRISELHTLLKRLNNGRDATELPALTDYSVLQLTAEVGTDLTKWPSEKHFTAWLGLAPGSHQSGKRRGHVARQRNRAGRLFCTLARSLARSVDKGLGGFYRRLRARRGGLVANQALARKLAILYWRVMVHGLQYVEKGLKHYEQRVALNEQRLLKKLAAKHGLNLTQAGASV